MDLSRLEHVEANKALGITKVQALNCEFASILRDVADELEAGVRTVHEMQVFGSVGVVAPMMDIIHLITIKCSPFPSREKA